MESSGISTDCETSSPKIPPPPIFVFTAVPPPLVAFSFSSPPTITSGSAPIHSWLTPSTFGPRKRARPLADIDGLDYGSRNYNKKRRLRLKLITSRLSAPFAIPPTNILDRGNCSRVALWAKTRAVARHILRKAAILNKIKRDAMAARAAQERQVEIARQQYREKLATAKSNAKKNSIAQFSPPLDQGAYVGKSRKAKGTKNSQSTCRSSAGSTPDPYSIPRHQRPPTPPSETELDWRRRGMGLGI